MHPILAKPRLLALYLGGWLPLGGLLAAAFVQQASIPWGEALVIGLPLSLIHASVSLASWYLCKALPLHRQQMVRLAVAHVGAAAASSALWLALGRLWAALLAPRPTFADSVAAIQLPSPVLFFAGMLVFLFAAAVHYLILAFEASRETERVGFELQVLARDAELRALRSQVDPHFLFNSLNSISALVTADPKQARQMCVLLSDLLRSSLRAGTEAMIPLADEMALVRQYLAIESLRFGDRLQSEIQIEPGIEMSPVPTLLLQPLVENSITHGISHLVEGGFVRLDAKRNGVALVLVVENSIDAETPRQAGSGTGLENVRKRLQLSFGGRAGFRTEESGERFRAEITLPLDASHGA
ncbi:MAG TPA: histidine kinase [Candidatus Krumholzibacteria bacterium]|nr:histidine kinase [Candidatus Krumholzibacteria bacterium]